MYELEVEHSHNISTNNDKLKKDEHQYNQNKNQKIKKMTMVKLIENEKKKCLNLLTSSKSEQKSLSKSTRFLLF